MLVLEPSLAPPWCSIDGPGWRFSLPFDIVGIGASAGGLRALSVVLPALPIDFPASVLVVQHLAPAGPSVLVAILGRRCRLPVTEAADGEHPRAGHVYIAPRDAHVALAPAGTIALSKSPLVRYVRPSIDVLFLSMAAVLGARAIGVVLSGTGSDGADGVRAIKARGGMVIVQDELTAEFFGMPEAAIRAGAVDHVLPLDQISGALATLVVHTSS